MKIAVFGKINSSHSHDEVVDEPLICKELTAMGHDVVAVDWSDAERIVGTTELAGAKFVLLAKHPAKLGLAWIKKLKKLKVPIVYWQCDHTDYEWHGSKLWPMHSPVYEECDLVLVRQKKLLHPFSKSNIQTAYDCLDTAPEDIYKPTDDARVRHRNPQTPFPERVRVGFVGNWLHAPCMRSVYVKSLAKEFGKDFHLTTLMMKEYIERDGIDPACVHNPIYNEDFSKLVGITDVNLDIENFSTPGFWSNRIARILLSGGFVIATYTDGMAERFGPHGMNLAYATSPRDMIEQTHYYLNNLEERTAISYRGLLFARKNLTYNKGVARMLKTIMDNLYGS